MIIPTTPRFVGGLFQGIGSLPMYPGACTLSSTKLKVVYETCTLPLWKLNVVQYTTQPKGKDDFIDYQNSVTLVGRLGRDPETVTFASGSYVRLSIATSKWRLAGGGEVQQKTEWHKVHVWDHRVPPVIKKGDMVKVTGEIRYHQKFKPIISVNNKGHLELLKAACRRKCEEK